MAHAHLPEGRSLRKHIPVNSSRYPGSSALASCHAASAARAHAPPCKRSQRAGRSLQRVLGSHSAEMSCRGLERVRCGGPQHPPTTCTLGQAVRVLTAAGRVHVCACEACGHPGLLRSSTVPQVAAGLVASPSSSRPLPAATDAAMVVAAGSLWGRSLPCSAAHLLLLRCL